MKIGNKSKNKNDSPSPEQHEDSAQPDGGEREAPRQENQPATETVQGEEQGVDEVSSLRTEVEQWKDKYLRAKAEQQNAIRRAENATRDSIRYANADLLRSVVDILDDLDRTIEAAGKDDQNGVLLEGVQLIQGKVKKFLTDNGVSAISAVGQSFDPAHHEALMQQPSDEYEVGTVIQQVQTGYMHRDRVLRPAKVIVAAAKPTQDNSDEQPAE